jgi:hypothetical protein
MFSQLKKREKMKIRRPFLHKTFFAILLFLVGPMACEQCPDAYDYFSINGIDANNARRSPGMSHSNPLGANDYVPWNEFSLVVSFSKIYYSAIERSGGYSLHADCIGNGWRGSKIGVDTLYLVTLNDYNDQYHKNDTINGLVLIDKPWSVNEFYTVEDYVEMNREGIKEDFLSLKISAPPLIFGDFQFRIIYILKNGGTFITESEKVTLTLN